MEAAEVLYLGRRVQGEGALSDLEGTQTAVLSPDGRYLYTAGPGSEGIGVFQVEPAGRWRQKQVFPCDGPGGEIRGVVALAISPDGAHLYGLSHRGRLAVLRRDSRQGTLELVEVLTGGGDPLGKVLPGGADLEISADGRRVYLGSHRSGIAVTRREPLTGKLSWLQTLPGGTRSPSETSQGEAGAEVGPESLEGLMDLALVPDGTGLLVAGGRGGWIAHLTIDPPSGELRLSQRLGGPGGDAPFLGTVTSVAVSPGGDVLFATGESPDAVTVFLRKDGRYQFHSALASEEAPALVLPFAVTLGGGGRHLYVSGSATTSALVVLEWSSSLEPKQVLREDAFRPLLAPARWVLSPDGEEAYGILDGIAVCRRDPMTGELEPRSFYRDGGGVGGLARASAVAVSPDGRHVYTAGDWGEIGVFEAGGSGELPRFVEALEVEGLEIVASLTVSSDGRWVRVTDRAGILHELRRWGGTGRLEPARRREAQEGDPSSQPSEVRSESRDGRVMASVEEGPRGTKRLVVRRRAAGSGRLEEIPWSLSPEAPLPGLEGRLSVAVSPDGRRIYLAASGSHSLSAFDVTDLP